MDLGECEIRLRGLEHLLGEGHSAGDGGGGRELESLSPGESCHLEQSFSSWPCLETLWVS